MPDTPTAAPLPTLGYAAAPPKRVPAWVWVIVAFAIALRIGYAATRSVDRAALASLPDQVEYIDIAGQMKNWHRIGFEDNNGFGDWTCAYRMPGYPALIALCDCRLRVVQGVQAVLDGSAVLAVFLIGRRLGSDVLGAAAAVLVAVHPFLIYFATLFLSETLFTAMLTWAVYLLLGDRNRMRCLGVALTLATVYVRPSAVALGVAAGGVAMAFGQASASAGRLLPRATAGMAIAASVGVLLLLPWAVRNELRLGHWVWLTTNDGFTAYDSFNPKADGSSNQRAFREWLATQQNVDGEVGRSQLLSRMAWDYARTHPVRDVQLAVAKLARFWSPVPLSVDFGGKPLYVVVGGLYCVPLFVFAAIGVVRGGLGRRATLTLLLPALYFTVVHSVAVGSLRYRVPCDVPLAVLAAAGVVSFVRPKAAT